MSSKSYEKLLQKLDKPNAAPIDPRIALLQQRFSLILESSKKDVLGHDADDGEEEDEDGVEDEDDLDEDDRNRDDFGGEGEDMYSGFDFPGEGELDDDVMIKMMQSGGQNGNDIDEEAQDEEDDELNIFEYDWDIERDESDSELDGNDNEEDNEPVNDPKDAAVGPKQKKSKTTDSTGEVFRGEKKDKAHFTLSLYDQYFNTPLSDLQIARLEAQSAFLPPDSDQVGLTLRKDLTKADLIKSQRNNAKSNPTRRAASKLKLFGHNHADDNGEDDQDECFPERTFTRVENALLRTGSMIDEYNLPSARTKYSNYEEEDFDELIDYDITKLTANQVGAQQLQIFSDRESLDLDILPDLPLCDSKYPVDEYGDGLIVTAGKERLRIEKFEHAGRKMAQKKAQLAKIKASSDKVSKMKYARKTPSWNALGLKQRLAQHLTEKGFFTPTAYNVIKQAYINYSSDLSQYDFTQHIQNTIKTDHIHALSKDHGLALPSYQNENQSLFASLLATYNDTFIIPSIPPPNQQVDWFVYRDVYLVHVVNHLLIHRDRIIAHNEAIYRRDARNQEQDFIQQLARIESSSERFAVLEKRLDELSKIMEDDKYTPVQQQEAQARLAVLTHSNKTRLQIKQLQEQAQMQRVQAAKAGRIGDGAQPLAQQQGGGKKKKGGLKGEELQRAQKRQLLDVEFQQQMSSLNVTKAKEELASHRSLNDTNHNKYRDQGYTRPCVLIIAPSKLHAYPIISRLLELLPSNQTKRIQDLERFHEDFGDSEGHFTQSPSKPIDYHLNFNGNTDDCFRFGLQLSANGVKLYSSLYSSDIIVASPLGLKLIVGNEGTKPHERKADFLSSIEICVADQLQLIMNQNINHFTDVLQCLNGYPTKTEGIDFSRIKQQFLNGHGRFYRQNIWCSGVLTPQLQYIYQTYCENKNGRLRIRPAQYDNISPYFKNGAMLKQSFYKLDVQLLSVTTNMMKKQIEQTIFDKKLHIWFNEIWPRVKDWYQHEGNTVIFVPSSYDFIRVRNAMDEKFVDCCICSEYTDQRLIDSYRTRIHKGTAKFLLVSERFWVFNRSAFTGIKHVVWYGVPTLPQAYIDFINYIKPPSATALSTANAATTTTGQLNSSQVNNLASGNYRIAVAKQPTSFVLYTIHDAMALERIVGTEFARELLTSSENMHTIQL